MNPLDSMLAALAGIPRLHGAECRGRSNLFDPPTELNPDDLEYAYTAALRICAQCPALTGCQAWFDDLPHDKRPPGVVAGRISRTRLPISRKKPA